MATLERIHSHRAASCSHIPSTCRARRCLAVCSAVPAQPPRGTLPRRDLILAFGTASADNGGSQQSVVVDTAPYVPTAHASIDEEQVVTKFIAETLLPTRHGKFRLRGYKHSIDGGATFTEPTAIIAGRVEGQENVPLRVHDACFTSEVLGSLKCDCAEQLELALRTVQKEPPGLVIYLQQEGRGIGLANKIAAYSLQEQGLDTVDANRALGLPDDCREYTSVRNMLAEMGVRSVRLITNNPRKINVLTKLGISVTGRIPCLVAAGKYNQGYLEAKRDRMAHMLAGGESEGEGSGSEGADMGVTAGGGGNGAKAGAEVGELNGDFCFWDHDGEPTQAVTTAYAKGGMDLPVGLAHGDNGRVVPVGAAPAAADGAGPA
ncbi:hypothetical protein PLESTB_001666300 [Pleodorina starrii]|uniref:GTP cyclohydrolase II n=1 Tax=Pleodorina starrii TaxID=330485 RepID=A0A9W6BY72_9CHLO|nr:hypothetical protein PLESTM_000628500 [Pleodorina starrii]GLC60746.1 hypothetical protein PLESTB_001666300 [Pleodorina starrii]GLC75463.1 hypothetical protein PLESTF_001640500 [Pleodorina starrii]